MKEEYKNLFDAASKLSKSKPAPTPGTETGITDLEAALDRCRRMYEEISRGLEFAFSYSKIDPHKFRAYFMQQGNFTQAEWQAVIKGKIGSAAMMRAFSYLMKLRTVF